LCSNGPPKSWMSQVHYNPPPHPMALILNGWHPEAGSMMSFFHHFFCCKWLCWWRCKRARLAPSWGGQRCVTFAGPINLLWVRGLELIPVMHGGRSVKGVRGP
uniref:Uncharacterized protein n=1 Tax=Paramormyrops kingsleyae TaxID=1676925 RepID=A0A3B3QIE1_9TELE